MSDPEQSPLSRLLIDQRAQIVQRWASLIRHANPLLRELPDYLVHDAMELFVEHLAHSIDGAAIDYDAYIAKSHGEHRQDLAIGLQGLIGEYIVFLDVVRDIADEHGVAFGVDDSLALARQVLTGAAASAHAFTRHRARGERRRDAEHFAFLAHDLRNPLSVIHMAWQLLERQGRLPADPTIALIDRSLAAMVTRLESSLKAMQDRVELGSIKSDSRVHAVGDLVRAACDELALAAASKAVLVERAETSPAWIDADSRLIGAAIVNVLHNAIKHSPHGGTCSVEWRADHSTVSIRICDGGPGIDAAAAEQIYEAFTRGDDAAAGFGLGLAIVREALLAHDGSIHLENRVAPDAGCCFTLTLPGVLAPIDGDPAAPEAETLA
ncbi:MAG: HAMP domain-containing sensor histidine kinase [bacterium]